jgi:hypothetical protein
MKNSNNSMESIWLPDYQPTKEERAPNGQILKMMRRIGRQILSNGWTALNRPLPRPNHNYPHPLQLKNKKLYSYQLQKPRDRY